MGKGSVMGEMSVCAACGKSFVRSPGWIYKKYISKSKHSKEQQFVLSYCTYGCMRKAEKMGEDLENLNVRQVEYDFKERGSYIDMIASKHHVSIDTIEAIVRNL